MYINIHRYYRVWTGSFCCFRLRCWSVLGKSLTTDFWDICSRPRDAAVNQPNLWSVWNKKTTYALKTPRVVALPFIYGVEYIIIPNQKRGKNNCHTLGIEVVMCLFQLWSYMMKLQRSRGRNCREATSSVLIASYHNYIANYECQNGTVLGLVTLTFDLWPWP